MKYFGMMLVFAALVVCRESHPVAYAGLFFIAVGTKSSL